MDKLYAIQAIRASVLRGSAATQCQPDAAAAASAALQQLMGCCIDPVAVTLRSELHATGSQRRLAHLTPYAIARNNRDWLLYVPQTGDFCLAFGEDPQALELLGPMSDDALAEWQA